MLRFSKSGRHDKMIQIKLIVFGLPYNFYLKHFWIRLRTEELFTKNYHFDSCQNGSIQNICQHLQDNVSKTEIIIIFC